MRTTEAEPLRALERLTEAERPPEFNLARGAATVTSPPPFDFEGVTMRFFPLKADFLALSRFCDHYLNLAPEFAYFRPSMPFVMLCIVNYGKMSLEAGNLGWTSQNEVLFSVPLEWYRRENGRWVFVNHAQVAPFIFVDDEASQIGGREVYGWPKVQGWYARGVNPWAVHPRNQRQLLGLTTRVFDRLYASERPEPREVVVVKEEPQPSVTIFPPRPDNPLNPIVSLPKAMVGWNSLLTAAYDMWTGMAMRGYSPIDRRALPNLVSSALGSMNVFTKNLQANTVNLKQLRDAAKPFEVCYQAITNAKMEITQFTSGGMLGDQALLRGDPSAGFSIEVSCYASLPIVDTLGLEVADQTDDGHVGVATLKPILPFWQEVDLRYLRGENLCWRTKDLRWRNSTSKLAPPAKRADADEEDRHLYNTTGNAGLQVATGPFRFPGATVRVLPLLADPAKLRKICDGYLNEDTSGHLNEIARFEPWGRYVYLLIWSFGDMSSETNNMGLWAKNRVEFAVPVRWHEVDEHGEQKLASVGFFSPFMFADSGIETTTGREVNGWTTVEAEIESPPNPWLEDGPFADVTPLLGLSTQVFPALGVGQRSEWRRLLEVVDGNLIGWQATTDWNHVAETWGREVRKDLESMAVRAESEDFANLRALALEILGNGAPLNQFSLKQFRDAAEPMRACYQALVRCSTAIERVHDVREIDKRIHVKIQRYPTQPIVDTLGLVVQSRHQNEDGVVDCLQPSRPFYMRVDLRSDVGENICWRAGSEIWKVPTEPCPECGAEVARRPQHCPACGQGLAQPAQPYFLQEGPTNVGRLLAWGVDVRPQRIRDQFNKWRDVGRPDWLLDRSEAAVTVGSDVEPQMVVHAMLSREWEHWGAPRWWWEMERQRREWEFAFAMSEEEKAALVQTTLDGAPGRMDQLPFFVVRRDSVGTAQGQLFPDDGRVEHVGPDPEYWSPTGSEGRRLPFLDVPLLQKLGISLPGRGER